MAHRWFTKLFGTRFDRELKRVQPIIDAIHTHEARLKDLSESELQETCAHLHRFYPQATGLAKSCPADTTGTSS